MLRKPIGQMLGAAFSALTVIVSAASMILPTAYAGDGAGSGAAGGSGRTDGTVNIKWIVKDAYPANLDGARQSLIDLGYPEGSMVGNDDTINNAMADAINECRASWTGQGDPECRLVATGIAGNGETHKWYHTTHWADHDEWARAYDAAAGGTYYHNGVAWTRATTWQDRFGQRNLNVMAEQAINKNLNAAIRFIVLSKDQPVPASYRLTGETRAQAPASLDAGSNSATRDHVTLNNNGSSITENVNATVTLHYEGQAQGYKQAQVITKQISLPNNGQGDTPEFTPQDFGLNGWADGDYWYDLQVAKQGKMADAFDAPDQEPAERFTISPQAPAAPKKSISKGVSADRMVNTTTITSMTGKGAWALDFTDTISANGNEYTVGNYRVTDKTTGQDITSQYQTAHEGNTVKAVRTDTTQMLPNDHEIAFTFDVTVAHPNGRNVDDIAEVAWNKTSRANTEGRTFQTRYPKPNKSWSLTGETAKQDHDPEWTNKTGVDTKTFIAGQPVALTVDGVLPKNLAQNFTNYQIIDDLSEATAHLNMPSVADVRVLVDGQDKTGEFTLSVNGSTLTATAKPSLLADTQGKPADRQVKLIATAKLKTNIPAGETLTLTNKGEEVWNTQRKPTNTPQIHVWAPKPDKSFALYNPASSKYEPVVDPSWSNKTGGDAKTFIDGDKVGIVVNATMPANLALAPAKLELVDDYKNAAYMVDAENTSAWHVYEADAQTDAKSSIDRVNEHGRDVTNQFTLSKNGTVLTAAASDAYRQTMVGKQTPVQLTLLVPATVKYANGKGAEQVRKDYSADNAHSVNTCDNPAAGADGENGKLANTAAFNVDTLQAPTNKPYVCLWVPPTVKTVNTAKPQGGNHTDVNGKVVYPDQLVEYDLNLADHVPDNLASTVSQMVFTDSYDPELAIVKDSVELVDAATNEVAPASAIKVVFDNAAHQFQATVVDAGWRARIHAGADANLRLRFNGTLKHGTPEGKKVNNTFTLQLNNMLMPANKVFNVPPAFKPKKTVTQLAPQGDNAVDINGRIFLQKDTGAYRVTLDATQHDTAYKVWKLGIVDDYDERNIALDEKHVTVVSDTGADVTGKFAWQVKNGVIYVFAKTVDTQVAATGKTVKGDPQPADLEAYSKLTQKQHDPLSQPAVDQSLMGHKYTVSLPFTVVGADKATIVNVATQWVNGENRKTNEVVNTLQPINPSKDVVVDVDDKSANGSTVINKSTFLYKLNSSKLPANRAYERVNPWQIDDMLNPEFDEYTHQWAVYADNDVVEHGKLLVKKGQLLAGSDQPLTGEPMFRLLVDGKQDVKPVKAETTGAKTGKTAEADKTGKLDGKLEATAEGKQGEQADTANTEKPKQHISVQAAKRYLDIIAANDKTEFSWTAYIQVRRLKPTERHENQFTETLANMTRKSNIVWTRTPLFKPSLHLEKWDKASGFPNGDRDTKADNLTLSGDGTDIILTITNTSPVDPVTGQGVVFTGKDMTITDTTLEGTGKLTVNYPKDWDKLVLKSGEKVDVPATLSGVSVGQHTDRAGVTGKPLTPCPVTNDKPFTGGKSKAHGALMVDGVAYGCSEQGKDNPDNLVHSNLDDWNAFKPAPPVPLALTGVGGTVRLLALAGGLCGLGFFLARLKRQTV